MMRIVILEDHHLYCFGLKYHFESHPDFRIAGDARTSEIFAMASEDTRPIVQSMMKTGINGFIGKRQAAADEFEKAIRKIAAGEQYIGRIDTNAHLRN